MVLMLKYIFHIMYPILHMIVPYEYMLEYVLK